MKFISLIGCLIAWGGILLISSCQTSEQMSTASVIVDEKPATLNQGWFVRIISFDGQPIEDKDISSMSILPGKHTMTVEYFEKTDTYIDKNDAVYQVYYTSKEPVQIEFEARADTSYDISGRREIQETCTFILQELSLLVKTTLLTENGDIEAIYKQVAESNYYGYGYRYRSYNKHGHYSHYPYFRYGYTYRFW